MRHRGGLMLVLLINAILAYSVMPTNRVLGARQPGARAWTIRQTLSFCRTDPRTRNRASSVRGYYFAFRPRAGPAAFAELLSSPSQVREVLQANSVPAKIGFGIFVAIPLLGPNRVRPGEPRSQSWVTLTGRLSCYAGRPPGQLIVRSYRYD
jgi:hypothetical protein